MVVVFPPQNYFAWKCEFESLLWDYDPTQLLLVVLTCLHAIAFSTGIVRLANRVRRQLWWWDDTILLLPLIVEPVMMVFTWLRFLDNKPSRSSSDMCILLRHA